MSEPRELPRIQQNYIVQVFSMATYAVFTNKLSYSEAVSRLARFIEEELEALRLWYRDGYDQFIEMARRLYKEWFRDIPEPDFSEARHGGIRELLEAQLMKHYDKILSYEDLVSIDESSLRKQVTSVVDKFIVVVGKALFRKLGFMV